jgi:hypothetical protein
MRALNGHCSVLVGQPPPLQCIGGLLAKLGTVGMQESVTIMRIIWLWRESVRHGTVSI